MTTTTTNFGLFKYDTVEDGHLAFNINTALNNNWDIIDQNLGSGSIATYETPGIVQPDGNTIYVDEDGILSLGNHGFIISSYHSGASWYRQYSDGFKMAGGKVLTSASDVAWSQPTLGTNGTLGGNSFAVSATSEYTSYSRYAYKAFDGISTTNGDCWQTQPSPSTPVYYTMYNPTPLKITSIKVANNPSYANIAISSYSISASNDNSSWTSVGSGTNTTGTAKGTWYMSINTNSMYYKYYRISCQPWTSASYATVAEFTITATYLGSGGTGITFPISFNDTNYSCMLGFQGGSGSSTYISSKTTTGMTLSSTPSATCYWIAMGW